MGDLFLPADRADELLFDAPAARLVGGDLDFAEAVIAAAPARQDIIR